MNTIRKDMTCNVLVGTSEYILQFFLRCGILWNFSILCKCEE